MAEAVRRHIVPPTEILDSHISLLSIWNEQIQFITQLAIKMPAAVTPVVGMWSSLHVGEETVKQGPHWL